MSIANKVFTVLTEFRFETQAAVAETGVLQRAVEKVSMAADQSMASMVGYAAAMVTGYFSVFKVISMAVSASEELTKSQLTLANIFSGQRSYLQGPLDTFAQRMQFSKQVLEDMSDVAKKFSLPEREMSGMVKMMAPVLNKAGVAGDNQSGAIDLSRKFLKAAPTLGVDPGLAQGQMVSMLTGAASLNDTLFRRLLTETDAFTKIAKTKNATDAFNKLDEKDRFKMISEGLEQFSKDMDVVQGMTGLLSSKMTLLMDRLIGIKGILVPLGDSILPLLRVALDGVIEIIDTRLRVAVQGLANIIKTVIGSPKTVGEAVDALTPLYATMKQISALKSDVSLAGKLSGLIGFMLMIATASKWAAMLGVTFPVVGRALSLFVGFFTKIGLAVVAFLAKIGIFSIMFKLLAFAVNAVLIPFLAFTALFQILSRAAALAKVQDLKNVFGDPKVMQRITDASARLMNGLAKLAWPFYFIMDQLARFLSPVFELGFWLKPLLWGFEALASVVEGMGNVLFQAMAGFQGLMFMLLQLGNMLFSQEGNPAKVLLDVFKDFLTLLHNNVMIIVDVFRAMFMRIAEMGHALLSGQLGKVASLAAAPLNVAPRNLLEYSDTTKDLDRAMGAGIDEFLMSNFGDYQKAKERMMVSNSVTNIHKVEIRQDFKENLEPDRVAHSVVRALGSLAKNPTQSAGRSMQGALLNGS